MQSARGRSAVFLWRKAAAVSERLPRSARGNRNALILAMFVAHALAAILVLVELVIPGASAGKNVGAAAALVGLPAAILVVVRLPVLIFALYAFSVPLESLAHIGNFGTIAKALGLASACVFLLRLILARKALAPTKATFGWILLLAWMAASLFWALDPNASGTINLYQVAQLFALYALMEITPFTRAELNLIVFGTILGGVFAASYGVNQFLHGVHPARGWERLVVRNGDKGMDFNHYAAAMQVPIALAWSAMLANSNRLKQSALAICLGLMLVGLLLGASRGGLVSLGVSASYLMWRSRNVRAFLIVLCIGAAASCAFPSVYARFTDPTQGEGSGRLFIWKVGLEQFRRHWIEGVGVGNFQTAYDSSLLRVRQAEFQGWTRESNSQVVCSATELGVVGFALLAAAVVLQFRVLRRIGPNHQLFPVRIALEAGLLALVAESIFIDTLWYKYVWLDFYLIAVARAAYVAERPRAPGAGRKLAGGVRAR